MAKSKPVKAKSKNTGGVPQDAVAMRAYELWCQRGMPHGADQKDWFDAEAELQPKKPAKKPSPRRRTRS